MIPLNSFAEAHCSTQPPPHNRSRGRLHPAETRRILKEWYNEHIDYPYLTASDVEDLARNGDLTDEQVKKWMSNRRLRNRNTLKESGAIHPSKKFKMQHEEEKKRNPEAANKYKKPRAQLPAAAVEILKEFYITNPYPTKEQRRALAEAAGITAAQVSCWFSNKRNRSRNTKTKKRKRSPDSQSESDVDDVTGTANGDESDSDTNSDIVNVCDTDTD